MKVDIFCLSLDFQRFKSCALRFHLCSALKSFTSCLRIATETPQWQSAAHFQSLWEWRQSDGPAQSSQKQECSYLGENRLEIKQKHQKLHCSGGNSGVPVAEWWVTTTATTAGHWYCMCERIYSTYLNLSIYTVYICIYMYVYICMCMYVYDNIHTYTHVERDYFGYFFSTC